MKKEMDRIVGARWYLGAIEFIREQNGITESDYVSQCGLAMIVIGMSENNIFTRKASLELMLQW